VDTEKNIKEAFTQLESSLREFIALLLQEEITTAKVFHYPRITKEATHDAYEFIPVTEETGSPAITKAITAYGQFRGNYGDSTKSVFRLPGVLGVKTENEGRLISTVNKLNSAKDAFRDACALLDAEDRFEIVHRLYPRLIYLQVVRHIHVSIGPLKSVNFTWGTSMSTTALPVSEALEMVTEKLTSGASSYEDAQRDIQTIKALGPSQKLALRRSVKVRPLVNLNIGKGKDSSTAKTARKEGHLPLLVINAGDFKTGTLRNYDSKKTRKERSDKRSSDSNTLATCRAFIISHE
jgi:DNA replication terminus site-binding protein